MKMLGHVEVPQEAFVAALATGDSANDRDTKDNAGEPACGEPVDGRFVHGVGVRFGRDLRTRRDAPQRADALHEEAAQKSEG